MGGLDTPLLVVVFAAAGAATWVADACLSRSTDALDVRFGLGEELGGLILLARRHGAEAAALVPRRVGSSP